MEPDLKDINHITKIDPAKKLPPNIAILEETDLILVGGSDGVTAENTLKAVQRIQDRFPGKPVWQEPYNANHIAMETVSTVDRLSIPAVYNGDSEHFFGKHVDLFGKLGQKPDEITGTNVPVLGDLITQKGNDILSDVMDTIIAEGYVIQHLESKAASVSGVEDSFTPEQVAGAALATESFYDFPILYIEYSGTYGGPADVETASQFLDTTALLYGGGIDSVHKTHEILDAGADAIVVGDCFHDDPESYLETIA